MVQFQYENPFPIGEDTTEYRLLGTQHVSRQKMGDQEFLVVEPEALTVLAREAMREISFFLREKHNRQ
ncbi:MAG: fumarate hydratase, partial [Planctomycetota bacterium]|nr:fumarate hydratase [Planctomycetota bacterium]